METTFAVAEAREMKAHLVKDLAAALQDLPEDAPPGRLADAVLADAVRERATDIHFEPNRQGVLVRLRIDGGLYDAMLLNTAEGLRAIRHFKAIAGIDSSQHFVPANARISTQVDDREIDLRIASVPCLGGEALTIRLLDSESARQRLHDLGLTESQLSQLESWLAGSYGLFIVSGPTGNGKTTTLYALLHELRSHDRAVFTIEDPVEYRIDGVTQMQVDHHHGLTFAAGLHAMLRLDPDHLLLGEIRDEQAAKAAFEAAGGGRVLMSTMSSVDAVGTVSGLRALGISDRELVSGLRCVVAQRLVRRLCPKCSHPADSPVVMESLHLATGWDAVGCDACKGLGYVGRVGVFEIWQPDDVERDLIQAHADEQTIRARLLSRGFSTLLDDAVQKAEQGVTSVAEVRRVVVNYPSVERLSRSCEPAPPRPRVSSGVESICSAF